MSQTPIIILGAGPAGLGAAYQLGRRQCFDVDVVERNAEVGGNAGSFDVAGLRVDFGSHRLHPSCAPEILADIRGMLGDDLLDRPRHGRIRLRGSWVHFPLKPADLALHLPLGFSLGVMQDSLRKLGGKSSDGDSFATVLEHGLGRTICRDFYFPYARKIWGMEPEALDAIQARRRVSAGSLGKMARKILNAVPGFKRQKTTGRFFYPRRGFGAISDAYAEAARKAGARIRMKTSLTGIEVENGRAVAAVVRDDSGLTRLEARHILSTIPISALTRAVEPAAPAAVQEAACGLKFRAMILVYLVLETDRFTEYDAHYFPDAGVAITRLSEPKNYGLAALPGATVLCAELPCALGDAAWSASDQQLERLVRDALGAAGLPVRVPVRAVVTRRLPQAYPIYLRGYKELFDRLDTWVESIEGLTTFGRQGVFAHDNTHHTLAMAYALNHCLDDSGELDRQKWAACRHEFEQHVVED